MAFANNQMIKAQRLESHKDINIIYNVKNKI
jgi:hypothetical protein